MSVPINGFCDERFLPLRDVFIANFEEGLEIGASLALTYRGKTVVDLWAGYADPEETRPWQEDTIAPVYSSTKMIAAICALMAVDRGLLKLDRRIAHYWPEFAQGGKEHVTVRDAFTHRAGVPGFISPVAASAFQDWSYITERIAAERHWFKGKRVLCYHGTTFGFILGELIRRVDGRKTAQFFREELGEKLGADFQIGLASQAELSRLAELRDPPQGPSFPPGSVADKVWNSVEHTPPTWEDLAADNPSIGGIGNGRSLAQVLAVLAERGEVGGTRFLSKRLVDEAGKKQVYAKDLYIGRLRFGLGFALDSKAFPAPSPASLHWGGYGGSWAVADPKARLSFGYAPNNLIVEPPSGDQYEFDHRLHRFSAVLKDLIAKL